MFSGHAHLVKNGIQAVKQSYYICCLTAYEFKGVQRGDVNNMKMMSRSISNPLSLT